MDNNIFTEIEVAGQSKTNGKAFPRVYSPKSPLDYIQVQRYFEEHREQIIKQVNEEGAIFFRGCHLKGATEFSGVLSQLNIKSFQYVGGAAVRKLIVGSTITKTKGVEVFTTNEAPPSQPIPFHNELMQNENYPDYISFFCYRQADSGGSTPLVHCGELYSFIEQNHSQFLAKLKQVGVRYSRIVGADDNEKSPIGRGWKNIFKVQTKEEAEIKMKESGYEFEWLGNADNDCRLTSKRLEGVRVSKSGKNVFSNQMVAVFKGWIDDKNCPEKCLRFGDNSEIPAAVMEEIAKHCDKIRAKIDWQEGDFVIIDNEMAKHAREPFTGVTRKIYAALLKGKDDSPNKNQTVTLKSGDQMPLLGFGTWKMPKDVCPSQIYGAIKAGYRLLDCAACYGNEQEVGQGIKQAIDEGIVKREELWVTSKLWNTFHLPKHVRPACEKTLKDMGLDYIDLYLIHWPVPVKYVDPAVAYPVGFGFKYDGTKDEVIEENVTRIDTWRQMEALVKQGLVRNIGVSNFNISLLRDLIYASEIKPSVNQIELHPYLTQKNLVEFCRQNDVKITSYSTMGGSSYIEINMANQNENITEQQSIIKMGEKHNKTPAQIILRWAIQQGLCIIPKTSKQARLKENADLFEWELTNEQMAQIDCFNINKRYCDSKIFTEMLYGQKIFVFE